MDLLEEEDELGDRGVRTVYVWVQLKWDRRRPNVPTAGLGELAARVAYITFYLSPPLHACTPYVALLCFLAWASCIRSGSSRKKRAGGE